MGKSTPVIILATIILSIVATPLLAYASSDKVKLTIIEFHNKGKPVVVYAISPTDDSLTNPDYSLLPFSWKITANYWINPSNKFGLTSSNVISAITSSVLTWDRETSYVVFSYKGTTRKTAGKFDGYNVVSWGSYRSGVIAVTYIWSLGGDIIETDTRMNNLYKWGTSGVANRMDVQNIMTHELGHWCGLDDLYSDIDYWLTMYGYADYGELYKSTLGQGDILGLIAVYG